MSFFKTQWLKMTEKPNIHNKTKCYYYQNNPPFYSTSLAEISEFISLSNLTLMRSQDSTENFNYHCYEIYSGDVFCFIMILGVHYEI